MSSRDELFSKYFQLHSGSQIYLKYCIIDLKKTLVYQVYFNRRAFNSWQVNIYSEFKQFVWDEDPIVLFHKHKIEDDALFVASLHCFYYTILLLAKKYCPRRCFIQRQGRPSMVYILVIYQ